MTVQFDFDGSDAALSDEFRAKALRVIDKLVPKMNDLMIKLQGHIVADKLSGQVLHHRSGKLAASIRVIEAHAEGTQLVASVEGAGGPAWYGRVHEYGGTFDVPEYQRRTGHGKKGEIVALLNKSGRIRKNVFGVTKGTVRAHTATFPERSFMRSSLEDMRAEIESQIKATLLEALGPQ